MFNRNNSPFQTTNTVPTISLSTATSGGHLADSTHFYYQVSGINGWGTETAPSAEVTLMTGAGGGNLNTITITWSAVPGAVGYNVYGRATSGAEQFIATTAGTSFLDDGTISPSGLPSSGAGAKNIYNNPFTYASAFHWTQLNFVNGVADAMATGMLTRVRRIFDPSGTNLLSELRRTTSSDWVWEQWFEHSVAFNDTAGGPLKISFTGGSDTTTSNLASPSIAVIGQGGILVVSNTSPTNITGLSDYYDGQIVTLLFTNGNSTLVHSGTFQLAGAVNLSPTSGATVTMMFHGADWRELGRSLPTITYPVQDLAKTTAAVSVTSGAASVDISTGATVWTLQPTTNITSWSFPTLPDSGTYAEFTIIFQQNGTTAKTVVSPATSGHTAGSAWSPSAVLGSYQSLGIRLWHSGTVELFPSAVMV